MTALTPMAVVVTHVLVALAAPAGVLVLMRRHVQVDGVTLHVAARREELVAVGTRELQLLAHHQRLDLRPVPARLQHTTDTFRLYQCGKSQGWIS